MKLYSLNLMERLYGYISRHAYKYRRIMIIFLDVNFVDFGDQLNFWIQCLFQNVPLSARYMKVFIIINYKQKPL